MLYINKFYLLVLSSCLVLIGCSKHNNSVFQDLAPDEDGVISVKIPEDPNEEPLAKEPQRTTDQLSATELSLINQWHEGEVDKISFIVVDANQKKILRSYYANTPQRLASVSKITTALGALENVNNVSISKVMRMLKKSINGEASRYVRLGAKALEGYVTEADAYSAPHGCPEEFLNDEPASLIVFDWLKNEIPHVDWSGATYFDGAGCHYDNFMSPLQTVKILEYAENRGAVYAGRNFEDLLSINGQDGTWKNKNLDHKGYIFAKTGTLNPNGNLAGYFYARRNGKLHPYYFTIFVQKKGPGQYSTNARKLMEAIMRYWINYYSSHEGQPLQDF